VLSGRGLCDELITRPEESYRLCCVVVCDLETSRMGAPYIYDISHLRVKHMLCYFITVNGNVLINQILCTTIQLLSFGPKGDKVTGEWRKLHNEELNELYSHNIVRVIKSRRMICSSMGERKSAYRVLVGKPEERPRRRWEDNNKMDLQEV